MPSVKELAIRLFRRHDGKIESVVRFGDLYEIRGWSTLEDVQLEISSPNAQSAESVETTLSQRVDLSSLDQPKYEFRHVTVIKPHAESAIGLLPSVRFQRHFSLSRAKTMSQRESLIYFTNDELRLGVNRAAFTSQSFRLPRSGENAVHATVRRLVRRGTRHVVISPELQDSTLWNLQSALIDFSDEMENEESLVFFQTSPGIEEFDGARRFSKVFQIDLGDLSAVEFGNLLIESLGVRDVTVVRPSILVSDLALLDSNVRTLRASVRAENPLCFFLGNQSQIAALSYRLPLDRHQLLFSPNESWNLDWLLSRRSIDSVELIEADQFLLGHSVSDIKFDIFSGSSPEV